MRRIPTPMAKLFAFLLVVGPAGSASAGLVARWHFDEPTGATVAADSVGSIDGTLSGDATFVPHGVSGHAVRVSRAGGGLVNMGNNFGFGSDFSVVAWVKTSSPGDTTIESIYVAKHTGGIVSGYFLAVNETAAMGGPGRALFFHNNMPAFTPISTTNTVNDGEWHQVVGTFQVGGSARIYVDGALEDTKPSATLVANAADFLVGGLDQGMGNPPVTTFDGCIDEVSLFDHALSPVEVMDLYAELAAPTLLANLSTGWDDGVSSLIAAPGTDDDWTLVAAPGGVTLGAAAVTLPSVLWFDPTPDGAAWIAPPDQMDSNNFSPPAGSYTFRYAFDIPSAIENAAFLIMGLYQSDDGIVEIRLNGNVLSTGGGGAFGTSFEGPFSSSDPSHFMVGTNLLELVVDNLSGAPPNPMGLVVRGAVRYGPGPPQVPVLPRSLGWLVAFALIVSAGAYLTRRPRSRVLG